MHEVSSFIVSLHMPNLASWTKLGHSQQMDEVGGGECCLSEKGVMMQGVTFSVTIGGRLHQLVTQAFFVIFSCAHISQFFQIEVAP